MIVIFYQFWPFFGRNPLYIGGFWVVFFPQIWNFFTIYTIAKRAIRVPVSSIFVRFLIYNLLLWHNNTKSTLNLFEEFCVNMNSKIVLFGNIFCNTFFGRNPLYFLILGPLLCITNKRTSYIGKVPLNGFSVFK